MAPRRKRLRRFFRLACLQVNAGPDLGRNRDAVSLRLETAFRARPHLIALPENFIWRGPSGNLEEVASQTPSVLKRFQTLAREHTCAFLLGSLIERSDDPNKFFNTSILISADGRVAARYRKIHLFDVSLERVRTHESRHIIAGRRIVTGRVAGIPLGLTICYDLRFPELFRVLAFRGCRIIFVPSNFTEETGKAHWEILLRARAIENQVFIAAPAQVGVHPSTGIRSFGASLVIDPWGRVLARGSRNREEVIVARLDLVEQGRLRQRFPVLKHCLPDPRGRGG